MKRVVSLGMLQDGTGTSKRIICCPHIDILAARDTWRSFEPMEPEGEKALQPLMCCATFTSLIES